MSEDRSQPRIDDDETRPTRRGPTILDRLGLSARDHAVRVAHRSPAAKAALVVGYGVWDGALKCNLPRMAAALAFRTIFGLIPVLVVAMVVLTAFATRDQRQEVVRALLDFTGLTRISVQDVAPPPPQAVPGLNIFSPVLPTLPATEPSTPEQKAAIDQWISSLLDRVSGIPFGAIGLVGVALLIYAAISMMVEIEKSFNQIYQAPTGRSWIRRVTQYWTLLTLGSLLLAASFAVGSGVLGWLIATAEGQSPAWLKGPLVQVARFLVACGISTGLFLLVYTVVPNTRVRVLPALVGAAVAAVLWEAGKFGFTEYLRLTAASKYALFYGSIALIPLFMLWVYLTWLVVLFGLDLAHAVQTARLRASELSAGAFALAGGLFEGGAKSRASAPAIVDSSTILAVAIEVARRFALGKASDHAQVAAATGVDERVVSVLLDRLAGAGFIHRVADSDREGTYTLSRPPERIGAAEVLRIADSAAAAESASLASHGLLAELALARVRAVEGRSLASFLESTHSPTPGPGLPEHPPQGTGGRSELAPG